MFLLLNTIRQEPIVINSDYIQSIYKGSEKREGVYINYSVVDMRDGIRHHVDETVEAIWHEINGTNKKRGLL